MGSAVEKVVEKGSGLVTQAFSLFQVNLILM